jgi:hypothetical protein
VRVQVELTAMSQLLDTGLVIAAIAALSGGAWLAMSHGLLVEPVDMKVLGDCGSDCSQVRCIMENQGPVRARGSVVIDAWTGGGYEDGTWRQEVEYDLMPGSRAAIHRDFEGLHYIRGKTIVRCMPWYAAGRFKPARGAPTLAE